MFCCMLASVRKLTGTWFSYSARSFTKSGWRCSQPDHQGSPLDGIRVLDITRILAGPYCTMILGDHGAEILKIEKPGYGDDTRSWGPPWIGSESAYFFSINRNKKSVAVNLKSSDGCKIIQKLATKCDVLVENYLPGKLAEMQLGYEQLKVINPQLIYVSITGFGQTGPYSNRAGYDNIAAAVGGLMHITGPEDGDPCRVGVAMTDLSTGLYAFGAIVSAILHRNKTGTGQHIDCNLLNTQVATLTHIASNYLNCGIEARRHGTGHGSIVPYQAFKTKDNCYMMVGAGNNHLFLEMCRKLDLFYLADEEAYSTNDKRVSNRKSLVKILSDRFAEKSLEGWMTIFDGSTFPYGPIKNMQQVFDDPQVQHNNMIQKFNHPVAGEIKVAGPALSYSQSQLVLQRPPPTLGQHTAEVLNSLLGYSEDRINSLQQNRIIQTGI